MSKKKSLLSLPTAHELIRKYGLQEKDMSMKVTHKLMVDISMHISKWREIAPHLGLEETERENIVEDSKTAQEQKLLMLEKWGMKYGNEASYLNLIKGFLRANRRDLAEKVCDIFVVAQNAQRNKKEVYHIPSSGSLAAALNNNEVELHVHVHTDQDDKPGSSPTHQDTALTSNNQTSMTTETKTNAKLCGGSICMLCCTVIIITLTIVGSTVYRPRIPLPASATVLLDNVLLIEEFDPFYIESVSFISATDTHIYKLQCKDLRVHNQTVERTAQLNTTEDQTYSITGGYYSKGSQLEYSFDVNFRNNTWPSDRECLAFIYIFESIGFFSSFLQYNTQSGFTSRQCIQNASVSLTAEQSKEYYIGLYIPEVTAIQSVEIGFIGHFVEYDISQYQPDCFVSALETTCTVQLERAQRQNSKICILATTPKNASIVLYQARGRSEIRNAGIAINVIGVGVFSLTILIQVRIIYASKRHHKKSPACDQVTSDATHTCTPQQAIELTQL